MPVEFHCPQCGKLLRVPDDTRGKKGRCPHCKGINEIPAESEPPAPGTIPTNLTPGPEAAPAPRPVDLFAAATGTPDLFANPAPPTPSSGVPRDVPGGLVPIPSESAPPYSDPLAVPTYGGNQASGYGGYAPAAYPAPSAYVAYSSPSYAASESEFSDTIDDSDRPGIPWERHRDNALMETVKQVLLSPAQAFGNMHRWGGIGPPLWFAVLGGFIGGIIYLGYATLVHMIQVGLAMLLGNVPAEMMGFVLIVFVVNIIIWVILIAIFGTLATLLGVLIHAGILHLVLMMLSGARAGFEATLRLTCYAHGSLAFLNIIPLLAPLAIFVMYYVVMIIGVRWTHEISVGKSVAAVLITSVIFVVLIVIPFIIFVIFAFMLIFTFFMRYAT